MRKGAALTVAAVLGYVGYRYVITAGDEGVSLVDDLSSTAQTWGNIMTTNSLPGPAVSPETGRDYSGAILSSARANGVPPVLLWSLIRQESRFRESARSPVGARGLSQFMSATAAEWGVDVTDGDSSINGAARYLAWLYRQVGTWRRAVCAYNWGVGNVKRKGVTTLPAETANYVRVVYDAYASQLPA